MSPTQRPVDNVDGANRHVDPMDDLEFSAHNLVLFTRVVTFFADDFLAECGGALTWKLEALAMLCQKTGIMAQALVQKAEEARRHAR
jgi:hypothetical protein